jgi:capsular polysaccharide biosynthesis protein
MTPTGLPPASKRLSLRGVARRAWVIPLTMIAVAGIALGVNRIRTHEVTAQSVAVVTSNAGPEGPGFATEASKLALTYSTVIAQDQNVITRLARTLGRSTSYVRKHFTVANPTDTAILQLRFRDTDPSTAAAGARAAAEAVAGRRPATGTVGAGSIQIVRLASRPARPADGDLIAILVGLVLGAGLGLVLVLAWERVDRRVDDTSDALAATGLPSSLLESLTPAAAASLLERWSQLSERRPSRIAIIPVERDVAAVAPAVAEWLAGAAAAGASTGAGVPESDGRAAYIAGTDVLGTGGSAESYALRSDVRVLLARRGARERDIDAAVGLLHQFGAPADWILLTRSPRKVRSWIEDRTAPAPPSSEQPTATGQPTV